jgi:TRAP transporter TAXI family solute receptor
MASDRSHKVWFASALGAPLRMLMLALLGAAAAASAAPREEFGDKFLMLGTGPVGGAFRPIGESLCDAVNEDRRTSLVRCVPMGTAGSTFNLHAVVNRSIQLGIAQEDLVADFYASRKEARAADLRIIAVLHNSPIAVMAHKSLGITDLQQIRGKSFNLGNRGSGQFAITASLMRALGLKTDDFAAVSYLPTGDFERAFCDRRVDVVVEAVAHPSALFQKLRACGGEFVEIPPAVITRLVADNPRLSPMTIPAGTYAAQDADVSTLGMRNVLVTSASVDEEAVYRLATTVRQRFKQLRAEQPMLGSMVPPESTPAASLPAPMHPGAVRALGVTRTGWAQ